MARKEHPSLKALGRKPLPPTVDIAGVTYTQQKVFKNDFFAVTARYANGDHCVILKVHRDASFLGVPLRWIGRLLAAKECAAFKRLRDVPGVPRLIDRWGQTGVIREYVEGHALQKGERVPDDFHDTLRELIDTIHQREMAYVDLEKCENVLVGDDGRPYLFDFQIAWYVPASWGGNLWPMRRLRGWFQSGDRYHLVKLQRRTRPDQMTPEQIEASYRRPWYVRVHRFLTWPLLWCRRKILDRIDPKRGDSERGRVVEHES